MSTFLDDLWYSWQMEYLSHNTREEQAALHRTALAEEVLLENLNDAQKMLLEDFLDLEKSLQSLYEKTAFQNGVRFAVRLFAKALSD